MTLPTANQLLAAQEKRANSLLSWLPAAIAKYGPSTSDELHAQYRGPSNAKYVSAALCNLAKAGVVVRLAKEDDDLRLGGPRKWVFGLAGQTYPGWKVVAGGQLFREKVFDMLTQQPATAEEVGAEFDITTNAASATLCDLRRDGRINRVGLGPLRKQGGRRPWMYGIGPEFMPGLPVKGERKHTPDSPRQRVHVPDPSRIAGRAYMPQYAGWGQWR